jgi:hypothetical protein
MLSTGPDWQALPHPLHPPASSQGSSGCVWRCVSCLTGLGHLGIVGLSGMCSPLSPLAFSLGSGTMPRVRLSRVDFLLIKESMPRRETVSLIV